MKLFKFGLRIWITVASVFVFVTSWIVFSHSPKPVQPPDVATVQLAPLPPMPGTNNSGGFFSLQSQGLQPRHRSMFVTGGS